MVAFPQCSGYASLFDKSFKIVPSVYVPDSVVDVGYQERVVGARFETST